MTARMQGAQVQGARVQGARVQGAQVQGGKHAFCVGASFSASPLTIYRRVIPDRMQVHAEQLMGRGAASPGTPRSVFDGASSWRTVVVWLVIGVLWRALLAIMVPPLPDETYYWEWTRHPQLSYFDHPPVIALLIRAGTLLLGDTQAGIRVGPAFTGFMASVGVTLLANNLAGARGAARAAILSAVLPMATLGMVLATPDSPLMMTVALSLFTLERALASPRRSPRALAWWMAAGVAVGTAMLTKYTAVLMPISFLGAALLSPALRRRFAEPGPWVAGAVSLLLFSPVVFWNAQHNWISFRFQLNHGFGDFTRGTPWLRELDYIGAQLGLASPVLFVLLLLAIAHACRAAFARNTDGSAPWSSRQGAGSGAELDARRLALASTSVVALGFFALSAWRRPVEPNWPSLMYPGAMALLATTAQPWANGRWWKSAIAVAVLLCATATLQAWRPLFPLTPSQDPIARAYGWDTLGDAVNRARHDPFFAERPQPWIASTRYEVSSEIAFHLPDRPHVHCLWLDGRPNQYDFWPTFFDVAHAGDGLVAVFDADARGDAQAATVGNWFESRRLFETVSLAREHGVVKQRRVWLFRNAMQLPATPRLPAAWVAR